MIECNGITKVYRVRRNPNRLWKRVVNILRPETAPLIALNGVDLGVKEGEIFGLLGPNGAGKSTLSMIVAGVLKPSSGEVLIDGVDIRNNMQQVHRNIGLALAHSMLYDRLTAYSYLKFFARVYGVADYNQRINELAKEFGLLNHLDRYINMYSLGMKMRLSLIRALLHDPRILVLDEFTVGLDPAISLEVRTMIKGSKKTVLLTTHNVLDAEALCDRVGFIVEGKLKKVDSPENLKKTVGDTLRVKVSIEGPLHFLLESLRKLEGVSTLSDGLAGDLEFLLPEEKLPELFIALAKYRVTSLETGSASLEQAYMKWAGRGLR